MAATHTHTGAMLSVDRDLQSWMTLCQPLSLCGTQFPQALQGPQTSPSSGGGSWVMSEPQGLVDREHEALVTTPLSLEGGLCPRLSRVLR